MAQTFFRGIWSLHPVLSMESACHRLQRGLCRYPWASCHLIVCGRRTTCSRWVAGLLGHSRPSPTLGSFRVLLSSRIALPCHLHIRGPLCCFLCSPIPCRLSQGCRTWDPDTHWTGLGRGGRPAYSDMPHFAIHCCEGRSGSVIQVFHYPDELRGNSQSLKSFCEQVVWNGVKGFCQIQESHGKGTLFLFLFSYQVFQKNRVLFDTWGRNEASLLRVEADCASQPFRQNLRVQSQEYAADW